MSDVIKIVVAGPFGAGKSTFIRTAASGRVLGSEAAVSDSTSALKSNTTVGMDHTVVTLPGADGGETTVSLYGTPGQERFSFMWPTIALGMHGYVLVVDGGRLQSRAQLKGAVRAFEGFAPGVPSVVAVNRWTRTDEAAHELAEFLDIDVARIVECDTFDQVACREVLGTVIGMVEHARGLVTEEVAQ